MTLTDFCYPFYTLLFCFICPKDFFCSHHEIAEILLKLAFKTNQSINQSIQKNLNYLSLQSLTLGVPDEGYSRNAFSSMVKHFDMIAGYD